MKYINEIFPEFEAFARLLVGENKIIKSINKIKSKIKNVSKVNEKTVIKLRDYNFIRFYNVLNQIDMILQCQDNEQYTLSESLGEMTDPNSLSEIFYQELELLNLAKYNGLKLNANVGTDGFDFFLGKYIYHFLERNVDFDILRNCVSIFTDEVDLASIEKEVMKKYNMKFNGSERFDLGADYFKDMKYNINLFFTSNVEDFYISEDAIAPYEEETVERKPLKMPESNEEKGKGDKNKPTIISTVNKDKER